MSAPAVAEPPVVKSVANSPRGSSDLFKAVQANEDKQRGYSPPAPPEPPPVAPVPPVVEKSVPAPVSTPPVSPKPASQAPAGVATPEVPPVNPLDLLKEPEGVKPVAPAEDAELAAKMAEWEKELPTAPEIKTPSNKDAWDKMRESYKTSKKEALSATREKEALTARIAELEKAPPVAAVAPEEIESLRKENLTLKQKNAVWALETNEDFVTKVLQPLDGASSALGSLMETYKITATDLDKAFSEQDRVKRNKLFSDIITDSGMNPLDTDDFRKAIQTVTDLSYKRDEGYANAVKLNEAAAAQMEQQKSQKAEMSKKQIEEEEGKIWEKISKNAPVIKDILADAKVSTDIRAKVKEYLGEEQTHEMKVFSAYASYILPHIPGMVKGLKGEIESLKEALKKAVGGEALAGGGHAPSKAPNSEPTNFKPGQAVRAAMEDRERVLGRR